MTVTWPYLSVIVPAHQGAASLRPVLSALEASDLPRSEWELVVVDDASTDDTATIAAEFADTIVRLPGKPHGPAYARNRGFELTRGEVIVFVDADVCVHGDTLRRFAELFREDATLGAAFGSYDANPPARGFVSQYRNLLHRYHHVMNAGPAETFWAGCGAIRANVFAEAQMYDEWHFPRPQIEDIELGHRMRARGHRILLRPEIECTHLKRWTLRSMVVTDLTDRGVPWSRLLVAQGKALKSGTLNRKTIEKVHTVLIWLMWIFSLAALLVGSSKLLIVALLCLLPVVYLNRRLYAFFMRARGVWFAVRVLPLHVLYYTLNGISAGSGWLLHALLGNAAPDPGVEAYSELGHTMWPPAPVKRTRWSNPGGSPTIR